MAYDLITGQEAAAAAARPAIVPAARPAIVPAARPAIVPAAMPVIEKKKLAAKKLGRGLTIITLRICTLAGPEKTATILREVAAALEKGAEKRAAKAASGRVVDMGWGWAAVAPGVPVGLGVGLGLIVVGVLGAAVRGIFRAIIGSEKKA